MNREDIESFGFSYTGESPYIQWGSGQTYTGEKYKRKNYELFNNPESHVVLMWRLKENGQIDDVLITLVVVKTKEKLKSLLEEKGIL